MRELTCDQYADLDPSHGPDITRARLGATREGRGEITVPFPHIGGGSDDILDIANFRAMLDEIPGAYGREPYGYRQAWLTFVATDDNVREYITCVGYILRDYPILDDSLYSELEYADAVEQWDSWGLGEATDYATDKLDADTLAGEDNLADALDALHSADVIGGADIASHIISAGADGFTVDGYHGESLNSEYAGEAMALAVEQWHSLAAYNRRTSNGKQVVLFE